MKKIALIDIGSNSMRLVVARVSSQESYKIIYELKETVRLGKDMDENSNLNPNRMDSAIAHLKNFKSICDSINVKDIIAVATEAVRRANNKDLFLKMAEEQSGIEIKVLSGKEEAYYDYLGVIYSIDVSDALIMDIGGCSTELILVENRNVKNSISLPFGAINITEKFNTSNAITYDTENSLFDFFYNMLNDIPWLNNLKIKTLIGVGGSIRNIGKIHRKLYSYPLNMIHNYKIKTSQVSDIFDMVKTKDVEQKVKIKGLSKERTDIFTGACAAVCSIINFCNIKNLCISGNGLRDGLLYEYLIKNNFYLENILDFSVKNLIKNLNMDLESSSQIYSIANKLFSELKVVNTSDADIFKILKTASLLHNCGISINYYSNHLHSLYIILNSRLYGLSHKELLMSAYAVSFNRKEDNKIRISGYSDLINKDDIEIIKKLRAIIHLSEYIYENLSICAENINCYIEKNIFFIKISSECNFKLEIDTSSKLYSKFKKTFKKNLLIE